MAAKSTDFMRKILCYGFSIEIQLITPQSGGIITVSRDIGDMRKCPVYKRISDGTPIVFFQTGPVFRDTFKKTRGLL